MLTQDPNKPSAHIEAANNRAMTYQANTGILIILVDVFDGFVIILRVFKLSQWLNCKVSKLRINAFLF